MPQIPIITKIRNKTQKLPVFKISIIQTKNHQEKAKWN